jgi:hypothetical protein
MKRNDRVRVDAAWALAAIGWAIVIIVALLLGEP